MLQARLYVIQFKVRANAEKWVERRVLSSTGFALPKEGPPGRNASGRWPF